MFEDKEYALDRMTRQRCFEIKKLLYSEGCTSPMLQTTQYGNVYITHASKKKQEQLKGLREYLEVLHTHGVKAKLDETFDEPYILAE